MRILVIEDDAEMRSLLEDFIEGEGIEVESAIDGTQALRKLAGESFDVIITEIHIPGLNGLDLLPGMKKIQPQSTVIAITALGSEEIHRRAMERGADACLEKPFHLEELKRLVHQVVFPRGQE